VAVRRPLSFETRAREAPGDTAGEDRGQHAGSHCISLAEVVHP